MKTAPQKTEPTDPELDAYGKVAYEAYCETRNWRSFGGDPLAQWDEVKDDIKEGWRQAAAATLRHHHWQQEEAGTTFIPCTISAGMFSSERAVVVHDYKGRVRSFFTHLSNLDLVGNRVRVHRLGDFRVRLPGEAFETGSHIVQIAATPGESYE